MKKAAIIASALVFLSTSLLLALSYHNLSKNFDIEEAIIFEVKKGASNKSIFQGLHDNNLISLPQIHTIAFKILKKFNSDLFFKSGEYQINNSDNYFSSLRKMLKGEVFLRRYTIAEGQTVAEVVELLNNSPYFTGEIKDIPEEGSILPETYFYKKGDDRANQLKIMQNDLEKTLNEAWAQRKDNLPLKNKRELLILASIVEKETGLDPERDHIAGVFINRLNKGMRLQSDPTVIYAVTMGKYKLERPLSRRDLRNTSKFNTYTNYGLPPTPIANPGKLAIFATAQPLETKDLYFVSDGRGKHRFSKTLTEHNKNVSLLRKYEREQKAKQNK